MQNLYKKQQAKPSKLQPNKHQNRSISHKRELSQKLQKINNLSKQNIIEHDNQLVLEGKEHLGKFQSQKISASTCRNCKKLIKKIKDNEEYFQKIIKFYHKQMKDFKQKIEERQDSLEKSKTAEFETKQYIKHLEERLARIKKIEIRPRQLSNDSVNQKQSKESDRLNLKKQLNQKYQYQNILGPLSSISNNHQKNVDEAEEMAKLEEKERFLKEQFQKLMQKSEKEECKNVREAIRKDLVKVAKELSIVGRAIARKRQKQNFLDV